MDGRRRSCWSCYALRFLFGHHFRLQALSCPSSRVRFRRPRALHVAAQCHVRYACSHSSAVVHLHLFISILWLTWCYRPHPCHSDAPLKFPLKCSLIASAQVLFGTGILDVADLKALDWHVLLLLGGGSALGRAIRESGLLHEVGDVIIRIMGADASPFALLAVFVVAILILTNFVSHTVASITMMPVVVEVVRCSLGKDPGQDSLPACLCLVPDKSRFFTRPLRLAVCPGHQRCLRAASVVFPEHFHFQRAARGRPARPVLQRLHQDRLRRRRRFFYHFCVNRVSVIVFSNKMLSLPPMHAVPMRTLKPPSYRPPHTGRLSQITGQNLTALYPLSNKQVSSSQKPFLLVPVGGCLLVDLATP